MYHILRRAIIVDTVLYGAAVQHPSLGYNGTDLLLPQQVHAARFHGVICFEGADALTLGFG